VRFVEREASQANYCTRAVADTSAPVLQRCNAAYQGHVLSAAQPELGAFVLLWCEEEEVQDTRFLEPGKRHKNEYSLNGDGVAILVTKSARKPWRRLERSTYQRRGLLHASFRVKYHSSGSLWGIQEKVV
jgi:hypothetical protein